MAYESDIFLNIIYTRVMNDSLFLSWKIDLTSHSLHSYIRYLLIDTYFEFNSAKFANTDMNNRIQYDNMCNF